MPSRFEIRSSRAARHGQLGAAHEWEPVLHHSRADTVAEHEAHDLRDGHERTGGGRCDMSGRTRFSASLFSTPPTTSSPRKRTGWRNGRKHWRSKRALSRPIRKEPIMASASPIARQTSFGATMRRDAWWVQPLLIFLALGAFIVYSTWAAFQGRTITPGPTSRRSIRRRSLAIRRTAGSDRSPAGGRVAAVFAGAADPLGAGAVPADLLLLSRRLLQGVLGRPARLRGGRAAEELPRRAFVSADHAECASLLSLSRAASSVFLAHDVWKALWFADPATGTRRFGIGVGTLVLAVNVVLLGGYTFGCHSLRHLVGGFLDEPSKAPLCHKAWRCVSCLTAATCSGPG